MKIIELSPAEVAEVYKDHLKRDFPSDELKPLFAIRRLMKQKRYLCYGLFENPEVGRPALEHLLAYAFFVGRKTSDLILLDYFAVVPQKRRLGLGSRFLTLLGEELAACGGMVAEIESLETAESKKDLQTRQRRLDFYLANGFRRSQIRGLLFGVEYETVYWSLGQNADDASLLNRMEALYRAMVPKPLFAGNVHFRLMDPEEAI